MNKYSVTKIEMTSQQADLLMVTCWDVAHEKMNAAVNVVINGYNIPPAAVRGLVAGSLNAFEDELREEWGIISRVPEGEE